MGKQKNNKWCIVCETAKTDKPASGMFWIHEDCYWALKSFQSFSSIVRGLIENGEYGKRKAANIEELKFQIKDIISKEKQFKCLGYDTENVNKIIDLMWGRKYKNM